MDKTLTTDDTDRTDGFQQGNRIKKSGHPERSIGVGEGGGPTRSEGSRAKQDGESSKQTAEDSSRTHGVLRLRDARHLRPPGIAPPQNDGDLDAIALWFSKECNPSVPVRDIRGFTSL